jgi:peptidoglycan/xylan/chitin deacetylase (PgdA/CDA1 family)
MIPGFGQLHVVGPRQSRSRSRRSQTERPRPRFGDLVPKISDRNPETVMRGEEVDGAELLKHSWSHVGQDELAGLQVMFVLEHGRVGKVVGHRLVVGVGLAANTSVPLAAAMRAGVHAVSPEYPNLLLPMRALSARAGAPLA